MLVILVIFYFYWRSKKNDLIHYKLDQQKHNISVNSQLVYNNVSGKHLVFEIKHSHRKWELFLFK